VAATRRIVVALSGASGAIYGIRSLEALRADPSVEIHAIVSKGARATIEYETDRKVADVLALAHVQYEENDLAAALASGTFVTAGMLVAPCSVRTMSAIAHSLNDNLIVRAADVHLKERRPLVLMVRETPLHAGHLKSMHDLAQCCWLRSTRSPQRLRSRASPSPPHLLGRWPRSGRSGRPL